MTQGQVTLLLLRNWLFGSQIKLQNSSERARENGARKRRGAPIRLCSDSCNLESIDINFLSFPLLLDMKTCKPPSCIDCGQTLDKVVYIPFTDK